MIKRCPWVLALLCIPQPAHAEANLREQLSKPVRSNLQSTKQPSQLQLCAADAVGEGLLPIPFSADDTGTVHIFGFLGLMGEGNVQRVVSLVKLPAGTRVEVRTRYNQPDDSS